MRVTNIMVLGFDLIMAIGKDLCVQLKLMICWSNNRSLKSGSLFRPTVTFGFRHAACTPYQIPEIEGVSLFF